MDLDILDAINLHAKLLVLDMVPAMQHLELDMEFDEWNDSMEEWRQIMEERTRFWEEPNYDNDPKENTDREDETLYQ